LAKVISVLVPESWTPPLVGMMMSKEGTTTLNQRRNFTPQFKTQVVLEILTRLKSTAQVCREYDLKEQVVTRWKADFLERAPSLFAPEQDRSQEQARIAELERLVGRLTLELESAKKVSQLLTSPAPRNGR
jgi:transposase